MKQLMSFIFEKKSKDRVTMVKIWFDKVIIAYILNTTCNMGSRLRD